MLSLTEWWKLLDEETRKVASLFPSIDYPKELTPFEEVEVKGEYSPWLAVHKMASLGAAIEANKYSLPKCWAIADKIEQAGRNFSQLQISGEKSLLISILVYRSQLQYHEIESAFVIKQGMALKQNEVDKATNALRLKIKNFCAAHPEIALSARDKFLQIFHESQGFPLIHAPSVLSQYTRYTDNLFNLLINNEQPSSFVELRAKLLDITGTLKTKLSHREKKLRSLYIHKALNEFITTESNPSLNGFIGHLQVQIPEFKVSDEAQAVWENAEEYANNQRSLASKMTEMGSSYGVNWSYAISGVWSKPFDYFMSAEMHRADFLKRQMSSYLKKEITGLSQSLHQTTSIKAQLLEEADPKEILDVLKLNQELLIEINLLKKSLDAYIEQIHPEQFGRIGKWLAKLDGRMKYLELARDFKTGLNEIKLEDPLAAHELNLLKKTILFKERHSYSLFANKVLENNLKCIVHLEEMKPLPNNNP